MDAAGVGDTRDEGVQPDREGPDERTDHHTGRQGEGTRPIDSQKRPGTTAPTRASRVTPST